MSNDSPDDNAAALAALGLTPEQLAAVEHYTAGERTRASNAAAAAARRAEQERAGRRGQQAPGAADSAQAPADPMAAIGALVNLQIAQALGNMAPGAAPRQASPVTAGPPPSLPPSVPLEDIPYHKMSPAQRDEYVARHGPIAAKDKIFRDMANVRIVGVRR